MEITKLISLPFGWRMNLHVVTYNGKASGRSRAQSKTREADGCTHRWTAALVDQPTICLTCKKVLPLSKPERERVQ